MELHSLEPNTMSWQDLATGSGAVAINDPVPETFSDDDVWDEMIPNKSETIQTNVDNNAGKVKSQTSDTRAEKDDSITSRPRKKLRAAEDAESESVGAAASHIAGKIWPMIDKVLETVKDMLGKSEAWRKRRDGLLDELSRLEGITLEQAMDAALILVESDRKLELFYGLRSDDMKKLLVLRLIRRSEVISS